MKNKSFELINYYYRPNKQVERKIIIDIIQGYRGILTPEDYCYIGMGSIYYYDFILLHKLIGISDLVSIDNDTSEKRFKFNKPYDFISFFNKSSSDYLIEHDFSSKPTIIWLDYDQSFLNNDFVFPDLSIISKEAREKHFIIITLNSNNPKTDEKEQFMAKYNDFISPAIKKKAFTSPKFFIYLLQNILINYIEKQNEYSDYKFHKLFSFYYKDGAPMYTLGGVFTEDIQQFISSKNSHKDINFNKDEIHHINIPKITYKEKFYLDSKITQLKKWIEEGYSLIEEDKIRDENEKKRIIEKILSSNMAFELSKEEVENYISNYKYFPQYYEGIL
ncbi:MAG TPA: hypothetical protein ENO27_04480 [Caldithrix sp.]|nr:hypothetical protein [Caldithrix sp.]